MTKRLAIFGLGHIGTTVYETLRNDTNFDVTGHDLKLGHDLGDQHYLDMVLDRVDGVLVATPFFLNKRIADTCNRLGVDYFDLTESVEVTDHVKQLDGARFVTQCGLAPGMVSIIAQHMTREFAHVGDIKIRVGALPMHADNAMQYYRTWNTEGLINEYINPCPAIRAGERVLLQPLTEQENVTIDGTALEAATTSGGLGSMTETWRGAAHNVDYKTLRYSGHWDYMRFLYKDLGMHNGSLGKWVDVFNKNVPSTAHDVVYIYISVSGWDGNKNYRIKQYTKRITHSERQTAIQITTAGGVMAVLDYWARGGMNDQRGWIRQEHLDYHAVWNSKYAECYR